MIRLDSIEVSAARETSWRSCAGLQPDLARLLGMKLHAGDVAALDDRREWLAVFGRRHGVAA